MRKLILYLSLKLRGMKTLEMYKEFKKREYASIEKNKKFQEDRLKKLLVHSWKNVPYYTKILEESGVVKNGRVNLKNFNRIPILTKEIIRENFENLKSKDLMHREWFYNSSGGSTGKPITLVQDRSKKEEDAAASWFQSSFANDFPCKILKLWGSERDILSNGKGNIARLRNWVQGLVILNSFKMSREDMGQYVKRINKFKPEIIEAYVDTIYELSKFIKEEKLEIHSPRGVMTTAGTLYPEARNLIEKVFNTKVLNRYGSREASALACSCKESECLHINIFTRHLEVLNKELKPSKPGEIGKIYLTTLNNYSMPLIRYEIGDMAIVSNKKCSCGRGLPLLEKVIGRNMEVFRTREGKIIPGEFFIHFLGVVYNKDLISKFQVIQEKYNLITVKVVPKNKGLNTELKKSIGQTIRKVMGKNCKVKWSLVKDIAPLKNGKYFYTISKIK